MQPTKNDLPESVRTQAAQLLSDRLADLIDLQLHAKQAHWNVKGPNFYQLHLLFDQVYSVVEEFVDLVAERNVALGGRSDGVPAVVAQKTKLPKYPLDIKDGRAHVEALATSLAAAGKLAREAIEQAEKIGDADTADLFTEVSRGLDKQLWFVEAHLQAER